MDPVFNFLGGRKMFLCICGIASITYLGAVGKIEGREAIEWLTYVVGIGAGSVAIENRLRERNRDRKKREAEK